MSKKAPIKKSRRRLKRSVRRSLAAVLMITAIAVAAVPVPENYAENDADADSDVVAVAYDYSSSDYDKIPFDVSLKRPANEGDVYKTKYIFPSDESSDGNSSSYRMEWQYEFYTKKVNGEPKGIICGYNDSYNRALLTVKKEAIFDYVVVTSEKYDEFKEKHADDMFSLQSKPDENDTYDQQFKTYFPNDYQKQVEAYQAYEEYQKKYDELVEAGKVEEAEALTKVEKPKALTKYAREFDTANEDELWRLYYCSCDANKATLAGYILVKVADSEATTNAGSVTTIFSYVPQRINLSEKTIEDDEYGFKIHDKTTFIGIGDEAFKDVQKVDTIELDEDINYIGDSAFEGSFIKAIQIKGVKNIGNYAFKECPYLSSVTLEGGVVNIGTEAFYGLLNLKEIVFPAPLSYIGPAAFANCRQLATVDFSKVSTTAPIIDDYAFYNDVALNKVDFMVAGTESTTVNIDTIGKAAFAVLNGATGSLTDFVFPTGIVTNKASGDYGMESRGMGDYVLAGRTNLQHVTMPADYGSTKTITIPDNLFCNCIALAWVKFPDNGNSCGLVRYNKKLFETVANPDFYVEGPQYTAPSNKTPAYPRESTWEAETAVSTTVPYVYYDAAGKKYIEVSDGNYLECIDENGVLISCTLKPGATVPATGVALTIPAQVGGTTVTAIASDCFTDDALNQAVHTLTIIDDSKIETIEASVFAGWEKLKKVYIGNSVRNIGKDAFKGCKSLLDVTFNTPESAYADFKIEDSAFETGGVELTFHGMIKQGYGPYDWAMKAENKINTETGVRVCYKSLTPSYLTVMYDDSTKQITLLDYPKYDQVETILGEAYATKYGVDTFKAGYEPASYYRKYMESQYYYLYSSDTYDAKREEFRTAWAAASDSSDVYNNYDVYGPWVTPEFCAGFSASGSSTDDSADNGNALTDWLFEPITAYAASGTPSPYFTIHPYSVYENYERSGSEVNGIYMTYTQDEENIINATKKITVPDTVTSIDVKGFLTNNASNAAAYLTVGKLGTDVAAMYRNSLGTGSDHDGDIIGGLFSGKYDDDAEEELTKGNDRLEEINLNQVTYLPKYAFDSCENLKKVTIGASCTDIGTLPFRGCTSLTSLEVAAENPSYLAANRILYSRNSSGGYTIEECLETRGMDNDNSIIDSGYDTNLKLVNEIVPSAFEACNYVDTVNLTDAGADLATEVSKLSVIPEKCFYTCEALDTVQLPASVNKIDKDAFSYANKLRTLRIPGREVFISTQAFADNNKDRTDVLTYEDSSARRYADTYAETYNLKWSNIGDLWEVNFYDMDGTQIGTTITVNDGEFLKKEQIPEDPTREGYTFTGWTGTGGVTIEDAITQPTNFIAMYDSNSGMINGKYIVKFFDGVDGKQLGKTQEVAPGDAAIEPNAPSHTGYKFLKFSQDSSNVQSNMEIIALYSVDTSTTSGGSTNTSGGSTNNNSSRNSSNSSSNSSSQTSSSTSSSSTSSGSASTAGTYTVTVENGSGSGTYAAGSTVIIAANTPADGMVFSKWTTESNGVTLASVSMTATTFIMPSNNVTVTANYVAGTSNTAAATNTNNISGGGSTATDTNNGNTTVDITKPGISNKDLANANVNGSTDNFVVKIAETDAATQAVAAALGNKYGSLENILYYAMDITLWDSTGTYQITGDQLAGISVDITIPIPDALVAYGGNNMAGAVVNGDQLESLNENFTTINGVPCIRFTATHFSPYTIYVDTGNLTEGMLDVTPKTGDPIHPKWFLSIGLACLSIVLFMKKDKKVKVKA